MVLVFVSSNCSSSPLRKPGTINDNGEWWKKNEMTLLGHLTYLEQLTMMVKTPTEFSPLFILFIQLLFSSCIYYLLLVYFNHYLISTSLESINCTSDSRSCLDWRHSPIVSTHSGPCDRFPHNHCYLQITTSVNEDAVQSLWRDDPSQADESEGFSYDHGRLRPCRVIIVRYILDEDAEDTEDADDDRSAFHSRTTMSV